MLLLLLLISIMSFNRASAVETQNTAELIKLIEKNYLYSEKISQVELKNLEKINARELNSLFVDPYSKYLTEDELEKWIVGLKNASSEDESSDKLVIGRTYEIQLDKGVKPGGKIGYLAIGSFGDGVEEEFEQNLNELKQENISSLVIDLRDNPGGRLEAAVNLAGYIIGCEVVAVKITDRGEEKKLEPEIESNKFAFVDDIPLMILVNENTVSAAEILAAAIKDHEKGILLGERTYGKGLFQKVYYPSNEELLLLTTAEYKTFQGDKVQGQGVEPHITVEGPMCFKQTTKNYLLKIWGCHYVLY